MLDKYYHQRVTFQATLVGSRVFSPSQYSLLFQDVKVQGRQECDRIWANMNIPVSIGLLSAPVRFRDSVSFTAVVEKLRNDAQRCCLSEIKDMSVIQTAKYHFDYTREDVLYQKAADLVFCSKKEKMKMGNPYEEFLYRTGIDKVSVIGFQFDGCAKNRLEFNVLVDGKKLDKPGYYRPYADKERLYIGQVFSFPITVQKEYFNLQNTYVRENFLFTK